MCFPGRVGVVARTLRLGQTIFLLVDIRQVEVFDSILSKLWLRLQLKGRRPTEGRRQDFHSHRDKCKSSLLGWKKKKLSTFNCGINCWHSWCVYLNPCSAWFSHTFDWTHRGQSLMVLPVFGRNRPEGKILETVGVFETVKQHGKYETGQVRWWSKIHIILILRKYNNMLLNKLYLVWLVWVVGLFIKYELNTFSSV